MTDVNQILKERGPKHGDAKTQFECAQELKAVVEKYAVNLSPMAKETLDMICVKQSRIVVGDEDWQDHWDDIAGYATLMSKKIAADYRAGASQRLKEKDIVSPPAAVV